MYNRKLVDIVVSLRATHNHTHNANNNCKRIFTSFYNFTSCLLSKLRPKSNLKQQGHTQHPLCNKNLHSESSIMTVPLFIYSYLKWWSVTSNFVIRNLPTSTNTKIKKQYRFARLPKRQTKTNNQQIIP